MLLQDSSVNQDASKDLKQKEEKTNRLMLLQHNALVSLAKAAHSADDYPQMIAYIKELLIEQKTKNITLRELTKRAYRLFTCSQ
mmetsp:Transcript_12848/g.14266  ORF Transcript_12848/g.14266 Transcript_12848/m.14266 type:complete len:84 (-) Transcript_12848:513-764(-)